MKLLSDRAAAALRSALDAADYSRWYKQHCGSEYKLDPWKAFCNIRLNADQELDALAFLASLFVLELSVPEMFLAKFLSSEVIHDLKESGFLMATDDGIRSNHCILSAFDKYLIVEYPAVSYDGLLVSSRTYLSSLSYDVIRTSRGYRAANKILELGCGTGLLSLVASKSARYVLATDIDPSALRLTQANIELNRSTVDTLLANMFQGIEDSVFDLVVFAPPWRLIPPEISYPNPLARVGPGRDGLDSIREFLKEVPNCLADGGRSMCFVEFPGDERGFDFAQELKEFTNKTGCSISVDLEPPLRVTVQAQISARTSWYLNKHLSIDELAERFLCHYHNLGYSYIHPAVCTIHNNAQGAIVYRYKRLDT